jgi:nitrogen regulatory protein PII
MNPTRALTRIRFLRQATLNRTAPFESSHLRTLEPCRRGDGRRTLTRSCVAGPGMKLICSLVRPAKLEHVKRALTSVRVYAFSVSEIYDHTPQEHETTVWRGHEYSLGFSPKLQIQVVVHDDDVDETVAVIIKTARTGHEGDGHVLVMPIDHRYNIRDGHRDVS